MRRAAGSPVASCQPTGGSDVGPCERYGPAYNTDNLCFDSRPTPLSPTFIPVGADAPIFPRQAILLLHAVRHSAVDDRVLLLKGGDAGEGPNQPASAITIEPR